MSAIFEPVRKLSGSGCFTGTLQSGHEHDSRWLRSKLYSRGIFAENLDELVANDLDDLLAGRKGCHHLLADGFRLHLVDELLYHFEIDVGFEKGQPQLAQRLLHVLFVENSLPAQGFEGSLKAFLKVLKHV